MTEIDDPLYFVYILIVFQIQSVFYLMYRRLSSVLLITNGILARASTKHTCQQIQFYKGMPDICITDKICLV